MALNYPDILQHNNPNLAIADSNFIRGGTRTAVADLTALYALSSKVDQLKQDATRVYVTAEAKYYVLVDIANVVNSGGWAIENSGGADTFLDLTDTPSTYTGQAGKATVVNTLETALVFVDFPSSETTSNITADLTVGGIDAGDIVPAGTNIQELAELLLTTTFFPTFVNPSFSLGNNAGTIETGSSASFTLTFNYDRGQIVGALSGGIWNPSLFQDFRGGASSSYTINGTTQAGNTLAVSGYTVLNGSNGFTGTVTYLTGPQPLDSKNLNYLSPYPSGTSASQSTAFTGLYPYFYYKSSSPITSSGMVAAIQDGLATKVIASSAGTLAIPYNLSAQYLAVAYPSSITIPTKTVYFVTTLDSGAITLVFNPVAIESVNSATGLWTGIDYKIHTSQEAITNSNTTIELRNS